MPKLNHELFSRKSRFAFLNGRVLVAAAALVLAVFVAANWGAIVGIFQSDEERFLAAYNVGDFDLALEIAMAMAAENPEAAGPQQAIASVYIQKALRNHDADASLQAAMTAALLAENLDVGNPETQRLLGYIFELQGDLAGAELRYRQGMKLDPESAEIAAHLAALFERRGLMQSALAQYEKAVRLDPGSEQARVFFARYHYLTGNRAAAIEQASLASTSEVSAYAAEANRIMSASLLAQGETDLARPTAERALELAPDSALVVQNYGELRLAELYGPNKLPYAETLAEVRELADRAIALNPNLAQPHFLAFKAAYAQGSTAEAEAYAAKALSLLADDPNLSPYVREQMRMVMEAIPRASATATRK
jgi:tetratricopeptide (TPR) repeat protein